MIKWFNQELNLNIDFEKYKEGNVLREKGHRDITLYSNDKKNVIIVENKSNGAGDQEKQILGYITTLEQCNTKKICVDGVLYINKYVANEPDHRNWERQYDNIKSKLLITKLLDDNSIESLLNKVINTQKTVTKLSVIASEIKNLFRIITLGSMNKETHKLFELISNSPINDQFYKVYESLNDFPKFFANKYKDDVSCLAKEYNIRKVDIWSDSKRTNLFIAFNKYTIDIEFFNIHYSISIVKEGTKNSGKIVETLKNNTTQWPFSENKIDNNLTNRYRTPSANAFDKEQLLKHLRLILDAFNLRKK